jgi:hypothetical protein
MIRMHLNSEKALGLISGHLEAEEVGFWNNHMSTCAACQQELSSWRKFATNLKRSHLRSAPDQDLDRAIQIFPSSGLVRPKLRTILASIIFDSFQQPAFAGARGAATQSRQLVLRVEDFDIHVKIWGESDQRQLMGQVLPRRGADFTGAAHFHLLHNGKRLESTAADETGEFHFTGVPEGELSLQIDLPHLIVIGALNGEGFGQS